MGKHKLLRVVGLVGGVLVVFVLGVGVYFVFIKNDTPKKNASAPQVIQTKDEVAKETKKQTDFDAVLAAYNEKNYVKTIELAMAYGKEETNSPTARLNAYSMCIDAAIYSKQDETKKNCYDDAVKVANSLPRAQAKKSWIDSLDAAYKGTAK